MKPTSIIFIILAAVLIVSGTIVCLIGGGIASSQDIELLCDTVDENGNAITTHKLDDYDLTGYNIDMENVDVNIIGQSPKSYIEFVNINAVIYDLTVSNHKFTLSTINPFNFSTFVKIRENGMGFSGLRHYLFLNKYKNKDAVINIYVTADQSLSDMKIATKNGDITVKNMTISCNYDLHANGGSVTVEGVNTKETLEVIAKGGDFIFDSSTISSVEFQVENGNVDFITHDQYNYVVSTKSGTIYTDDKEVGSNLKDVYPETKESSDDKNTTVTVPNEVDGMITSGDMTITVKEDQSNTVAASDTANE